MDKRAKKQKKTKKETRGNRENTSFAPRSAKRGKATLQDKDPIVAQTEEGLDYGQDYDSQSPPEEAFAPIPAADLNQTAADGAEDAQSIDIAAFEAEYDDEEELYEKLYPQAFADTQIEYDDDYDEDEYDQADLIEESGGEKPSDRILAAREQRAQKAAKKAERRAKMPVKKIAIICAVVLVVVAIAGVTAYIILNDPERLILNAFADGDLVRVNELYIEHIAGNEQKEQSLAGTVHDYTNSIVEDYNRGKRTLEEATAALQLVTDAALPGVDTAPALASLNELAQSKQLYLDAQAAEQGGQYLEAMLLYQQVHENDTNRSEAVSSINRLAPDAVSQIESTVSQYRAEGKLLDAARMLNLAVTIVEDANVAQMKVQLNNEAGAQLVEQAKALDDAGNLADAMELLATNTDIVHTGIEEQMAYFTAKQTVLTSKETLTHQNISGIGVYATEGSAVNFFTITEDVNMDAKVFAATSGEEDARIVFYLGFRDTAYINFTDIDVVVDGKTYPLNTTDTTKKKTQDVGNGNLSEWYVFDDKTLPKDLVESMLNATECSIVFKGEAASKTHVLTAEEKEKLLPLWQLYNIFGQYKQLQRFAG
ncbi:hypothetical protein LJC55_01355 [Eubacteriales bacterium OttesenSCG-928-N14]|nr:hypothetical protein [Eubacteriales bacterium OttesenSCG-928-N14]